jgi:hypothetical protein
MQLSLLMIVAVILNSLPSVNFQAPKQIVPLAERTGAPEVSLHLDYIRLASVGPDHVELSAQFDIIPGISANLQEISFSSMRMNGQVPVFIAPLYADLALKKDQKRELPPLQVTIYYADLPSLEPLKEILDAHNVKIGGEMRAELRVSLLNRLILRNLHPTTVAVLDQDVPFRRSAADAPTQMGVDLLALVQKAVRTAEGALGLAVPAQWRGSRRGEGDEQLRSVLLVHTAYRAEMGGSEPLQSSDRLGFWIGPHLVLIPDEALQPWAYSPLIADGLAKRARKVDEESVEVTIQPLVADEEHGTLAPPWSLKRGDFSVYRRGKPDEKHVVLPAQARDVVIRQRGSAGNFAVLQFRKTISGHPINLTPVIRAGEQIGPRHWGGDQLSVIRRAAPAGDVTKTFRLLEIGGGVSGGVLHLSRPLDDATFGSPVVSSAGAIGMVQSETGAIALSSIINAREIEEAEALDRR